MDDLPKELAALINTYDYRFEGISVADFEVKNVCCMAHDKDFIIVSTLYNSTRKR